MAIKTTYTTATGASAGALDKEVGNLLREGFRLYGDPYAATLGESVIFCQAMVGEDGETMAEQIERAQAVDLPSAVLPADLPATALER